MSVSFVRRSALGLVLALALAFAVLVQSAKPAEAFVPAIFAYPAAETMLGGAAAAGPVGWVTAGAILVGVGAWYAYDNREEIGSWFNDRFSSGTGVSENGVDQNHIFRLITLPGDDWPTVQFQWGPGVDGKPTSLNFNVYITTTCHVGTQYIQTNRNMGYLDHNHVPPQNFSSETQLDACRDSGGVPYSIYAYRASNNAQIALWVNPAESQRSRNLAKQDCLRANGSTFTITGREITSQQQPAQVAIPSCSAVEPGTIGVKVDLCSRTAGGADALKCGSSVTVDKNKLLPGGQYQDCGPGHTCELQVKLNGVACQIGMTGCVDWYSKLGTAFETNYSCLWGPYSMPLTACKLLKDHYLETAVRDPNTGLGTAPAPVPTPSPSGSPGAGGSTVPESGTNDLPVNGPDIPASEFGQCMGQGWSWNPVSWVYVPTRCALRWAFVPEPGSLQDAFDAAGVGWQATRIPEWGESFGAVGSSLGDIGSGAGGCAGPHFSITLSGQSYAFDPLNACGPPMSTVAVVVKLFASVAIVVVGARFVIRPLMSSLSMGDSV